MPWIGDPQITLKAGYNTVKQYPHGRAIERFADLLEERTGENLTIATFPAEAAGSEKDMLEAVILGTLDMAKVSTGVVSAFVPEFGVFDLPYVFRDLDHMMKVLNSAVTAPLIAKLENRGVKILFWMEQGTRSIYTTRKLVRTPEDLKGLKIRTMQSPIMADTINRMGGSATPMPFGELYTALKQGVVDGAENAPDAIWYSKQYEVVKYFSLTNQFRTPVVFVMNKKKYDSLPNEYRKIFDSTAKETQEWAGTLYSDISNALVTKLKEKGVEIVQVDETPFRQAVQPIYQKYGEKFGDLLKKIQAVK